MTRVHIMMQSWDDLLQPPFTMLCHPTACRHYSLPWAKILEYKLVLKGKASPGTQPSCLSLLPHPPWSAKNTPTLCSTAWNHARSMFWDTEKAEAVGNTDLGVTSGCKAGSVPHSSGEPFKFFILAHQYGQHNSLVSNFLPIGPGFTAKEFENPDAPLLKNF